LRRPLSCPCALTTWRCVMSCSPSARCSMFEVAPSRRPARPIMRSFVGV
jgi:hypothetical protein